MLSHQADKNALPLVNRHYSRRTHTSPQFMLGLRPERVPEAEPYLGTLFSYLYG